jgi:hypothetical protein
LQSSRIDQRSGQRQLVSERGWDGAAPRPNPAPP